MKEKKVWPTSFKAKPVAQERIAFGRMLGLSIDKMQNDLWEQFGRQYLEKMRQAVAPVIKKQLDDPIP